MRKTGVLYVLVLLALTACLSRPDPLPTADVAPPTDTPASLPTPTEAQPATQPPAATDTAAPEATPTETSEPPSPTPTVVADTPTPAATATPDPNQGVGEVAYQDPLDGSSQWFWTFTDEVASFGIADGRLRAVMSQANSGWRFSISPSATRVGSQQVRIGARPTACGDNDEYGLMFRVGELPEDGGYTGYLFRVRCGGQARFDLMAGTGMMTIVDWTDSPAIQAGAPADNTLMVWAAGNQFRFYVNDEYLFSAQDSSLADGFFGVYLYDRTAGGLTVEFTDLVARSVTP